MCDHPGRPRPRHRRRGDPLRQEQRSRAERGAGAGTPSGARPRRGRGRRADLYRHPSGRPHPSLPDRPAVLDVGRRDGGERRRGGHRQRGRPLGGRGGRGARPDRHGSRPARPRAVGERGGGGRGHDRSAGASRPGRRLRPPRALLLSQQLHRRRPARSLRLETVDRWWAVQRVERVRAISNVLGIGAEDRAVSSDLQAHAEAEGWCDAAGRFDVAGRLWDPERDVATRGRERRGRATSRLAERGDQIAVADMMRVLRDHGAEADPDWSPAKIVGRTICMHAGGGDRRSQSVGSDGGASCAPGPPSTG